MKQLIVVIVTAFIFSSCADRSNKDLALFKITEESLSRANINLHQQSEYWYRSIDDKLHDVVTKEIAGVWQPKSARVKELTSDIIKYIEALKADLVKEAGIHMENDEELLNSRNTGVVEKIFKANGKALDLYSHLKKYKDDILSIDPMIRQGFENGLVVINKNLDADTTGDKKFSDLFFKAMPVIAALSLLSSFENNIDVLENNLAQFCHSRIGYLDGPSMYERFQTIMGLSSSVLSPGSQLEVTVGVGQFSSASVPRFTINGKNIPTTDAVVTYKFKTPLIPGRYSVPVKIEYTKPDGTKGLDTKKLEYSVAQ